MEDKPKDKPKEANELQVFYYIEDKPTEKPFVAEDCDNAISNKVQKVSHSFAFAILAMGIVAGVGLAMAFPKLKDSEFASKIKKMVRIDLLLINLAFKTMNWLSD
jgi:hypothetical protein